MDPKFRVSIPVSWRPEEGEELTLMDSAVDGTPMIRVLTNRAVEQALHDINHSGCTSGQIRNAVRFFYSTILPVKVSSQGKILIPKEWSTRANIAAESNVTLVGCGDYFEIYNAADYAIASGKQKASVLADMAHINFFST